MIDEPMKYTLDFKNKFSGRKKIVIEISLNDFLNDPSEILKKYLPNAISIHNQNCIEMEKLYDLVKSKQNILDKVRPNGDTKINNKLIINYANEFTNFKKGYYIGRPIKYVNATLETNDSMSYLLRYNKDINKQSKDLTKYENLLITGIAHTFIDYNKKPNVDLNNESPYDYIVLDNKNVFVAYSNDIMSTKLFSCYISKIIDYTTNQTRDVYTCYFNYMVATITNINGQYEISYTSNPIENPITEYTLNQFRMGAWESVISIMNNLNKIRSIQIDQVEEHTNSYITFENVDIDNMLEKIDKMRANRILVVNTNNPNAPAKIGSISLDLDLTSVNSMFDSLEQRMYDIVGVPMPTSSTGQGVSGEAQTYGGGWENAQTIANVDTQYVMQFENEDLKKMLYISRSVVNSKTIYLYANDIDIKYTINKSNNMMVKSQSAKYFYDMNMPKEMILEFCEISPDAHTNANQWQEYENKKIQEDIVLEIEKTKKLDEATNKNNNSGSQTTSDNIVVDE